MARTLQVESINSSSTGLDLQTLGASRLFIKNDGNVGIGSTNPQDELDLGNATAGRGITWAGTNGASRYNSIFSSFSGGGLVFSAGFHGSVSADSYISSFTGTQGLAGIRFDSFGGVAGAIRFFTDAAASRTAGGAVVPTERLRITASGGISFGSSGTAFGTSNQILKSNGNASPTWILLGNDNIDASAAIAYSKLNLATSIVNADISASAAIAYSKLSLGTSIVNADISASAAIAYSKLSLGTSIVNADISASAGIVDTKLATISTASKVSNSATTATSANTASAIVARDASGNFSAGTITAALSGNATTATTASTANALTTGNNYQVNSLGVGTAASASAGEIRATGNITAYYVASDKRLKENITPLKNVLKKLENINGYNFNYKTRPNQKMVGVIAQELLEEFPELIYETAPIDEGTGLDKVYTVRYELLTSILLQAIKELSSEVNKLKEGTDKPKENK